jgi:uncharacterized protein YrrD
MKKSVEILGLPIISITEGRELGISKSLLIDAKNGAVAALTIDDEDWYRGVKLLPYASVIAIGDDAVTITNSENIIKFDEANEYEPMLDANVQIIGTKAITKSGSIQGKVTEIFIGEGGKIEKCEIHADDSAEAKEITANEISIFGKEVTVIDPEKKNDSMTSTEKKPEGALEKPVVSIPIVKAAPAQAIQSQVSTSKADAKPEVSRTEPTKAEEKSPEKPADQAKQLADKASEERHRRFLLGKKATRRIAMDNGIVIVEAGADITEEVLQKAKLANKFIELSMNVQ